MTINILKEIEKDFRKFIIEADKPKGSVKEEIEEMNQKLLHQRCLARGKVLPNFVKPFFITLSQVEKIKGIVNTLLNCQEKMIELYFKEPEFRPYFELTPEEVPLVSIPSQLPRFIYFSRMDAISTGDSFKFLEFNCDSPGGAYYSDLLRMGLENLSFIKKLSKKYKFYPQNYRPKVLQTLLEAWASSGRNYKPHIAVVGNPDVANVEEFKLFAEYFNQNGYSAYFTDPWHFQYDGVSLQRDGKKAELLYRRGILADYSKHLEETKSIINAYRDKKVLFVNPLSSKLGDNKNLLALLTDPRISKIFSEKEKSVIHKYIPWTRLLREMKTEFKGKKIDLIPFVRKNKDLFVIKPNSQYGGKGVVIGKEVKQKQWEQAIEESYSEQKVVQEYVPIPTMEFPIFNPELTFVPKKYNVNFFTFAGKFGGGFVRTSDSSVINISAGGALVSFFIIDDR